MKLFDTRWWLKPMRIKNKKTKTDLIYNKFKQYETVDPNKKIYKKLFKKYGKCYRHRFKFENNYGASVVKQYGSYGYEQDLFELAVIYYEDENDQEGHLLYNTPITNDVVGYLRNDEVLELLDQIKQLKDGN